MRQTPNIDLNLFDSTDEIEVDSRLAFNDNFEKLDIEAGKTDEMYDFFSQVTTQLNMYGGKTLAFNQLQGTTTSRTNNDVTYSYLDGVVSISGTASGNSYWRGSGGTAGKIDVNANDLLYFNFNCNGEYYHDRSTESGQMYINGGGTYLERDGDKGIMQVSSDGLAYTEFCINSGYTARTGLEFKPMWVNLTKMFGAGNEPTLEQCEAIFISEYYPYNAGELKSAQVNKVIIGNAEKNIPAEVIALDGYGHSAGTVYNSVEWVDGRAYFHKRVESRAYQSGDEDDATVITDGTTTYYPITEVVTEITNLFPSNFNIFSSAGETSFEFVDSSIAWEIPYNSENTTKISADKILYDTDTSGLSANNVQGAIDELAVDYIVERGTSGIWTYEKWNSGKAVCWGTTEAMSIPCTTAWGDIYTTGANSVGNTQFPFEFVEIPIFYATFNDGGTTGRGWVMDLDNSTNHLTTTQTGDIPVARAVSYTFTSSFKFYAIGRWK